MSSVVIIEIIFAFFQKNLGWFIGALSIFYVYKQFKIQSNEHKTEIFVNAINFMNHDTHHEINRENIHSALSIFKLITKEESLKKIKSNEFLYSITITKFLIEHIRKIKNNDKWREFYQKNLRDYYEIGYLVLLVTKTLPKKNFPIFYCFKDFFINFENIYNSHLKSHSHNGQKLFETLIQSLQNNTQNIIHVKGFSDADF